jgi:HD domain
VLLDVYRPLPTWFAHNPNGIHGIGHVTRVLVWADQLARVMISRGVDVDIEAVRWAAVVHDVGRLDDGIDAQHGVRSGQWIAAHRQVIPVAIPEQQLRTIQHCCVWHVPPDRKIPHLTNELRCLKDADGLDRVRLGDLDAAYLRSDHACSLQDAAQQLYEAARAEGTDDPWWNVREAALALNLWR